MTTSLYVTTSESKSGRSLITLGIAETLLKTNKQIGFFRAYINNEGKVTEKERYITHILSHLNPTYKHEDTYAMTRDEAMELIKNGRYDDFIEIIIKKYKALEETCDFILCEGTSYSDESTAAFEMDINADIAKNLGAPVMIVANALNRDVNKIETTVTMANDFFKRKGCKTLGTIVNRASDELLDQLTEKLTVTMAQEKKFFSIIPEKQSIFDKSGLLLKCFKQHVDVNGLRETIISGESSGITYKMFEYELLRRAQASKQHIVLPEGEDDRVLQAAETLKNRNIVDITILGDEEKIHASIKRLGIDLTGIPIVDPHTSPWHDEFVETLFELRKAKGLTIDQAKELMYDVSYFGTMMLHTGKVDGMVSGAAHTTGETIRPALQIIKTSPGCSVVSSTFLMCLEGRIVTYGDCAVNPNPTAQQLAEIAISSAETAKAFQIEPKVALLSYSSGVSGAGPDVEKVAEATKIAKEMRPDLLIEGPIQYDAAVVPAVGEKKMPGSKVAGKATVLVFPDLNTGNNTYKAVQREGGAEAIGPVLQGIKKPMNDLSRGCSVLDIVNTTIVTAIQAQALK